MVRQRSFVGGIASVVLLVAGGTGCSRQTQAERPEAGAAAPAKAAEPVPAGPAGDQRPAYRVKRLPPSKTVNVGDRSLAEWTEEFKVMEIPASRAASLQWTTIRGNAPKPRKAGDFAMKVYMAWDARNWYVAFQVTDNVIRAVPPSSIDPYSGDCVELYFAGAASDSEQDFHDLLVKGQRALLQLAVPPVSLDEPDLYLADWRTDSALIEQALKRGFRASAWRTTTGWDAEAAIPLAALDASVLKKLTAGEPLKAALTYLNYNEQAADEFIFQPDNVFCLDPDERNVNTPRFMRSIVFER